MAVYKCPIHDSWIDPEREETCAACKKTGGKVARAATRRHRFAASNKTAPSARQRRASFLLKVLLLLGGAATLALPRVQSLLRDQGLEEVADRAEQVSGKVESMAKRVEGSARSAAERLGGGNEEDSTRQGAAPATFELPAQRVALLTTNTAGHTGVAWLPPRDPAEKRPLLVWLHAAGDDGAEALDRLAALSERYRFAILAPESLRGATTPDHFESWRPGKGAMLVDDEQHILGTMTELREVLHFAVDPQRVLLVGSAGGALTALHLATHDPRFSHVALVHDAPGADALGDLRPKAYLAAGTQDRVRPQDRILASYEQLRAKGLDLQLAITKAGHPVADEELESIVHWWLANP